MSLRSLDPTDAFNNATKTITLPTQTFLEDDESTHILDTPEYEDPILEARPNRYKKEKNALSLYLRDLGKPSLAGLPLPREKEYELAEAIQKHHSPEAEEELFKANLRLVVHIAKQYTYSKLPLADIIQEGNLGCRKAVIKYDPSRPGHETKFSTYAWFWIKQAIRRGLDYQENTIRIPSTMRKRIEKLTKIARQHLLETQKHISVKDLAERMDLSEQQVLEALDTIKTKETLAYIPPADNTNGHGRYKPSTKYPHVYDQDIADKRQNPAEEVEIRELIEHMAVAFRTLNDQQKTVLSLRYGLEDGQDRTLEEVGQILGGLTRERIRQVQNQAFRKIRWRMEATARRNDDSFGIYI